MWSFIVMTEINAVHTGSMAQQAVVGIALSRGDGPDLNGSIERSRGELVGVLWIDTELHYIMLVVFVRIHFLPVFVPIIHVDFIIVTTTENIWERRMHYQMSDEIGMLT